MYRSRKFKVYQSQKISDTPILSLCWEKKIASSGRLSVFQILLLPFSSSFGIVRSWGSWRIKPQIGLVCPPLPEGLLVGNCPIISSLEFQARLQNTVESYTARELIKGELFRRERREECNRVVDYQIVGTILVRNWLTEHPGYRRHIFAFSAFQLVSRG